MARPKKEKELLHHHQIMLRLTDTEYEIVFEKAKDANLPLAEYARKQVLNLLCFYVVSPLNFNICGQSRIHAH